jgi:hypothetical protein
LGEKLTILSGCDENNRFSVFTGYFVVLNWQQGTVSSYRLCRLRTAGTYGGSNIFKAEDECKPVSLLFP